jgi:hypothetical protein
VAAIQRAARLEDARHDELARSVIATFDGPLKAAEGLPAFQAESKSGRIVQGARGCANSGILLFTAELDPVVASHWYGAYEKGFWKDTGWIAGFTEMPRGSQRDFMDVDSGPVLCEVGSVASAFGIGAAKTVGRFDHAAPLTMELVAFSWPTPLGFLIPGLMGRLAANSWSLGEVALLFSMTRPTLAAETVPFDGPVPYIVWVVLVVYLSVGMFSIWFEIRSCRRMIRWHRAMNVSDKTRRCHRRIPLCCPASSPSSIIPHYSRPTTRGAGRWRTHPAPSRVSSSSNCSRYCATRSSCFGSTARLIISCGSASKS